jgi:hypothetical protein
MPSKLTIPRITGFVLASAKSAFKCRNSPATRSPKCEEGFNTFDADYADFAEGAALR